MQISVNIDKFSPDKVFFCNRTENTVINGGGFYRVMYCDTDVTMLGIHITFVVDMTIEEECPTRLDVREALTKITPRVMEIITDLINSVHQRWESSYGPKAMSYPVTPHSVEPAILKALLQVRNELGTSGSRVKINDSVIRMPFVFKCAGVFDTDDDAGVSFRLNSVTRL